MQWSWYNTVLLLALLAVVGGMWINRRRTP